ncbi:AbrB/MazE/SpoVT family DNA-binding domain-containing protein [Sphingomonas yunnanensis]|uniref:AbrB/MazE/SpoVT family DNA-binding domain-containing protein n=1 Tax=Sphingomonas yunnanensis TaxID=310400 RepID=UPI001CA7474C|nr:AbrB/MazE/SpoVT family DNA-binding domain-containing protein [Sphingomonas yunnanensis]MBY9063698.1 AbrB/MazE/SpoVT family DNA-binding domain-containing protein [Sphingomonas yunnanensis]
MNAVTRLSDKGQVVVPKAIRDLKGWAPGLDLEVVDAGDGVLLRPRRTHKSLSVAEAVERMRAIYTHKGPPVTLEEMDEAIAEAVAERDRRTR